MTEEVDCVHKCSPTTVWNASLNINALSVQTDAPDSATHYMMLDEEMINRTRTATSVDVQHFMMNE